MYLTDKNDEEVNFRSGNEVSQGETRILNFLSEIGEERVQEEIFRGLSADPPMIPSKFFYDRRGSGLFEEITHLEEYYPTRTEKKILATAEGLKDLPWHDLSVVELGSGDASKISLLLDHIPEKERHAVRYFPVDISHSAIDRSAGVLRQRFPEVDITGIVIDYFHQLDRIPVQGRKLFCFFGSTIGNFDPRERKTFMTMLGGIMNPGDSLLLGLDMVKDQTVLEKAYNDSRGVTAAFNRNILNVVNNLAGTGFVPADFTHEAFFNRAESRIEMHLRARKDVTVTFEGREEMVRIPAGKSIHTENSYKFTEDDILQTGRWAGLLLREVLTDERKWFSLGWYEKK